MHKKQLKIRPSSKGAAKVIELIKGHPESAEDVLKNINLAVREIIEQTFNGDIEAQERLLKIHKECYPSHYVLKSALQRAMSIRYRMAELSYVVTPTRGRRFLPPKNAPRRWPYIKLREAPEVERIDGSIIKLTDNDFFLRSELYTRAAQHFQNRESKNWTLQSLAIHDYSEEKGQRGIDARREVFRILERARKYEKERRPELFIILASEEVLPYYPFAET